MSPVLREVLPFHYIMEIWKLVLRAVKCCPTPGTCIWDDHCSHSPTQIRFPSYITSPTTTKATQHEKRKWKPAIEPSPKGRMGKLQFPWEMVLAFLNLTLQSHFSVKGDLGVFSLP